MLPQGGWSEFDRICELTIKEWASMAEAECERLSALVRTWDTHMRQLAEKVSALHPCCHVRMRAHMPD